MDSYLKAYRTMVYLEEEEEFIYLQKFNQTDIKLEYIMDRQFCIAVTVNIFKKIQLKSVKIFFMSTIKILGKSS